MFNDEDSDEEEPDNTMNAAQQHVAGAVNDGFTSLNNACLIVASDIGAESPMSKVSMVTEKVSQSSLVERLKHVNAGDSAAKSLPLHIMFARYFNEAILGNLSPGAFPCGPECNVQFHNSIFSGQCSWIPGRPYQNQCRSCH